MMIFISLPDSKSETVSYSLICTYSKLVFLLRKKNYWPTFICELNNK
jgi:hypothetical protein